MANLKLRVKLNGFEFEAEGNEASVSTQFQIFRNLCASLSQKTFAPEFPSSHKKEDSSKYSLPYSSSPSQADPLMLHQVFRHDPLTSHITCRILPTGPMKTADTILLLLFGHHQLLGQTSTSALALNQALMRSGGSVERLDRVLATYLKEQWILKAGKGKGGKYRLSKIGIQEAVNKMQALVQLLPEEPTPSSNPGTCSSSWDPTTRPPFESHGGGTKVGK